MPDRALIALLLLGCQDKADSPLDGVPIDETGSTATDSDGDGYDATEDCDDNNSVIHPGADEICDGVDNNCDGQADEGVTEVFYADRDEDGFGDPSSTAEACEQPPGYVSTGTDCDDGSDATWPGASEQCDGEDNDCDGAVDEEVMFAWYADADGDGFGNPDSQHPTCDPPPGYVTDGTDCDDTEERAHPGREEVCDTVDNDCDGAVDEDVTDTYYRDEDGDGYGLSAKTTEACAVPSGYSDLSGDCDDGDRAISPSAAEVCDDADNDCDGGIDTDAVDQSAWYADSDGDGFGDASVSAASCDAPSGYVADLSLIHI